ncbi:hypothetical protein AgCh_004346 [Apium graveolens]
MLESGGNQGIIVLRSIPMLPQFEPSQYMVWVELLESRDTETGVIRAYAMPYDGDVDPHFVEMVADWEMPCPYSMTFWDSNFEIELGDAVISAASSEISQKVIRTLQSSCRSEFEGDQYDEMLQQMQQQIQMYTERTNAKLQMIEELVNLAVLKVQDQNSKNNEFINPFGGSKSVVGSLWENEALETLRHLKLNFPRYAEGKGVAGWIEDYELYYEIFGIQNSKKVMIVGMHLEGVSKSWYKMYAIGKLELNWSDFCSQFTARFGVRK